MIVLLLNEERINLTPASTLTTRTSLVAGQANVERTLRARSMGGGISACCPAHSAVQHAN